jgi:hypothetical protein
MSEMGHQLPPTFVPAATGAPQKAAIKAAVGHLGCGPKPASRAAKKVATLLATADEVIQ